MRTIKIDILNEKAFDLLKDLESLKLIRLQAPDKVEEKAGEYWTKYKGAMSKQSPESINQQLKAIREAWE